MKNFGMDGEPWAYFSNMALKDSVEMDKITGQEKKFLQRYLKLSLARQLWRNEGYYEVLNAEDEAIKKAVEVLYKPS
jgi:carboxyl-terminal processing protease